MLYIAAEFNLAIWRYLLCPVNIKSEYVNGAMFAMVGASRQHNLIAGNIFGELRQQLKAQPCEAYTNDMRVRIPATGLYTYPGVVAVCGEPEFEDEHIDTLLNPVLVVEVLAASTESYDRGKKAGYYCTVASLVEYLLVAQDEYRVEQYVKQADGKWLLTDIRSRASTVELVSVPCALPMSEIYSKVALS